MMKALYSGVSGMKSHQTKMDVIGNNIANVNTYSFKSQRATFRDVYYQTMKSPSSGSATRGGTNASQVGYGAQVGSIDTIHSLSGYSPTDKATDLYINGEGFFVVKNSNGDQLYTRLGAFNFDSEGKLVDASGSMVCGTDEDPIKIAGFDTYKNITINVDGTITAFYKDATKGTTMQTLGTIAVANIPNQDALILEGNSYYRAGNNTESDAAKITYNVPGTGGTGAIVTNGLEMSNVDLAKEFSDMIITQRGFQANTKIISVVDQMLEELVNLKR